MFKILLLITCVWLVCGQDIPIVPLPTIPPRTTTTTAAPTSATTPTTTTTTTTTSSTMAPLTTKSTTRAPSTTTTTLRPTRITTARPTNPWRPNTTNRYPCKHANCFYYKLFITASTFHCKKCCTFPNTKLIKCFFVPSAKCKPTTNYRPPHHYHHQHQHQHNYHTKGPY